jgi:hypothetical protein
MDALRRQKLRHLLDTKFGNDRQRLVKAAQMTKGRLSQLLDPAFPFGDRAARNLEDRLGLPAGYFDSMDPRTLAWATTFDALPESVKAQWEHLAKMLAPPHDSGST